MRTGLQLIGLSLLIAATGMLAIQNRAGRELEILDLALRLQQVACGSQFCDPDEHPSIFAVYSPEVKFR